MVDLLPVARIDDPIIGAGASDPLTLPPRELYRAHPAAAE